MHSHRLVQLVADRLLPFFGAWPVVWFQFELPVAPRGSMPRRTIHDEQMAWLQLFNLLEDGTPAGHHPKGQIILKGFNIHFARNARVGENGLQFRAEDELLVVSVEVDRLDADAVSRQQQALR